MSKQRPVYAVVLASLLSLTFAPSLFADPVDDAREKTDSIISAVFAAVLDLTDKVDSEFSVDAGNHAVTTLLGKNRSVRLVGTLEPLGRRSKPRGRWERTALADALTGVASEKVQGGQILRTFIPLPNLPGCDTCHTNYAGEGDWVGGLSIKVKLLN